MKRHRWVGKEEVLNLIASAGACAGAQDRIRRKLRGRSPGQAWRVARLQDREWFVSMVLGLSWHAARWPWSRIWPLVRVVLWSQVSAVDSHGVRTAWTQGNIEGAAGVSNSEWVRENLMPALRGLQ